MRWWGWLRPTKPPRGSDRHQYNADLKLAVGLAALPFIVGLAGISFLPVMDPHLPKWVWTMEPFGFWAVLRWMDWRWPT